MTIETFLYTIEGYQQLAHLASDAHSLFSQIPLPEEMQIERLDLVIDHLSLLKQGLREFSTLKSEVSNLSSDALLAYTTLARAYPKSLEMKEQDFDKYIGVLEEYHHNPAGRVASHKFNLISPLFAEATLALSEYAFVQYMSMLTSAK